MAKQIELFYQPKRGGWASRSIEADSQKVRGIMSHFRIEAELRCGREVIGEVYWHDDPLTECYERNGKAHWCWWFDLEAVDACKEA